MTVEAIRTLDDVRRHREQIIALARQYRVRQVSIFGSLIRGELHAESDIDFLVEFESGCKMKEALNL